MPAGALSPRVARKYLPKRFATESGNCGRKDTEAVLLAMTLNEYSLLFGTMVGLTVCSMSSPPCDARQPASPTRRRKKFAMTRLLRAYRHPFGGVGAVSHATGPCSESEVSAL